MDGTLLVINGPNLNLLGTREPEIYGNLDLEALNQLCVAWAEAYGYSVKTYHSNHEGDIIDRLHASRGKVDGIVLNAGAYTHTSYAIHDAIAACDIPTVEVHISNVQQREPWRKHSVIAAACTHTIYGRGIEGYKFAIGHLATKLENPGETIEYGIHHDQVGDLRVPDSEGPHPVIVLIHGGFWKQEWTRDIMDPIALDLTRRGYATWNIEYRRVGGEGGWPETFFDVASAIDNLSEMASEHQLDVADVSVVGHSAGGQLALWSAGRATLSTRHFGADPLIRPRRILALAPIADLAAAQRAALGDDAVDHLVARVPRHTDIYRDLSPIEMLPLGVDQLIVHGDGDEQVPVSMSESYVAAAIGQGDNVDFAQLAGVSHMDLINPHSSAWSEVTDAL